MGTSTNARLGENKLSFEVVELLQSKGCQKMEQNNESYENSACHTNECMSKLVCGRHVFVQGHLHPCLRRKSNISDVAQLASYQAPDCVR